MHGFKASRKIKKIYCCKTNVFGLSVVKPKIMAMDNLPLRGFLKCRKWHRMLIGSASNGKMDNYY